MNVRMQTAVASGLKRVVTNINKTYWNHISSVSIVHIFIIVIPRNFSTISLQKVMKFIILVDKINVFVF